MLRNSTVSVVRKITQLCPLRIEKTADSENFGREVVDELGIRLRKK